MLIISTLLNTKLHNLPPQYKNPIISYPKNKKILTKFTYFGFLSDLGAGLTTLFLGVWILELGVES